jgi:hypothetical protein
VARGATSGSNTGGTCSEYPAECSQLVYAPGEEPERDAPKGWTAEASARTTPPVSPPPSASELCERTMSDSGSQMGAAMLCQVFSDAVSLGTRGSLTWADAAS